MVQTRHLTIREKPKTDNRTLDISVSSETPVERWFGKEILSHAPGAIDLSRLADGAPLLFNHDLNAHIGAVSNPRIVGGKLRAEVRFGKSQFAEEKYQDVMDDVLRNVSITYEILEVEPLPSNDGYLVTRWLPLEVSFVTVPADNTVGKGRAHQNLSEGLDNPTPMTKAATPIPGDSQDTPKDTGVVESRSVEAKQVDVQEIRRQEQERIAVITATCNKFGCSDLADELIRGGRSVSEMNAAILERLSARGEAKPLTGKEHDIGLSEKEVKQFSLLRALNALANPNDKRAQEAAAYELEVSNAAKIQSSKAHNGIQIPADVMRQFGLQQRDLLVGTASAGGNTVATDLLSGSFIDILRNRTVVANAGATMLRDLEGFVAIPSQTGTGTAYWVAENAAAGAESDQTFGQVTLSPKTLTAYTDISRRLLLQSSIDVENLVRNDLMAILGIEIDRAALHGSGSGQEPTGIAGVAGIGSVAGGTDGALPTFQHVVNLETEVAIDNADFGSLAYITNPKVRGRLKTTPMFSNTATPVFYQNEVNGYPCYVTNQVRSNLVKGSSGSVCSAIFYGNWADLLIGMWGGLAVTADPYTFSTTGALRIVVMQDADIKVRRAVSFAAMLDALTA